MMIDATLADGRTTFRFPSRKAYVDLVSRDPKKLNEHERVRCWADYRDGQGWIPKRLMYVRPHSVSTVTYVEPAERDEFLAEHDPERLERIRAMEAAQRIREMEAERSAA